MFIPPFHWYKSNSIYIYVYGSYLYSPLICTAQWCVIILLRSAVFIMSYSEKCFRKFGNSSPLVKWKRIFLFIFVTSGKHCLCLLSHFCIIYYARQPQQSSSLEGKKKKALLLGCTTIKGKTSLSCSSLWFWMSHQLSELLRSLLFFLLNLFTLWNVDSHYGVLYWTLNNRAPVSLEPSSPVIICTMILKERETDVSVKVQN